MAANLKGLDPTTLPGAGVLRRLAALLYDGFLVAAIWMLMGFLLQLIVGPDTSELIDGVVQTDPLLDAVLFLGMLGSAIAFYLWFWCQSGQTLGMLAWRLRVQDLEGQLLHPSRALLRFVLAWPSFFSLGLGYLWLLVDKNHDAAHDRLSKTRVVLLPKEFQPLQ